MAGTRTILAFSALLGIGGFVVALSALPVDHAPARAARERVRAVPTLEDAVARIRFALSQGRPERALNIANRATELYPQEPDVWLWKIITSVRLGSPAEAAAAGEQLRTLITANPPPLHLAAQSRREYRLGWAMTGLGDHDTARAHFLLAAEFYQQGGQDTASRPLWLFNLACYLAMGGQADQAAQAFADAVDAGYSDGDGWWSVDPDLDPIRHHPVFLQGVAAMAERQRAEDPAQNPPPDTLPPD